MIGPGKYDDLCTEARTKSEALGAVLIILNGNKGNGFCVQAPLDLTLRLPSMLRVVADTIESDHKKGKI